MRVSWAAAGLVAVSAGLTGCGGNGDPGGGAARKAGAKLPVEVTEARYEALDAALKEWQGTVVLVDFWATWCGPCVKKFPQFVELHKKYADQGLTCMSVSMDKAGPVVGSRDEILAFLKDKQATFPNFVLADPEADEGKMSKRFGEFDAIPYMVMFDRSGKKVWDSASDPNPLKPEELEKRVEAELVK
jgi:thiol-disulfide isomerase/thioredoxin